MSPPLARAGLACAAAALAWASLLAAPARAEYRAYELEVVDRYDCAINKRETCKRFQVRTSMSPDVYARTHGGEARIGVVLLATWMCRGDTSRYRPVCPRPQPVEPRFNVGDTVRIQLDKHITDGWEGKVELVYYQASVGSNVYGVRFPDRQNVFARYFEKDLVKAGGAPAPRSTPPQ